MSKHHRSRRSGAVLICVMACLLVSLSVAVCAVQIALRQRQGLRAEVQLQQTTWLLEAGVNRAIDSLAKSSRYNGEIWQPKCFNAQYDSAEVTIKVTEDAAKNVVQLDVTAALGRESVGQTKRSCHLHLKRPTSDTIE